MAKIRHVIHAHGHGGTFKAVSIAGDAFDDVFGGGSLFFKLEQSLVDGINMLSGGADEAGQEFLEFRWDTGDIFPIGCPMGGFHVIPPV